MSDTQKRLAEIEARLKAATPGPWVDHCEDSCEKALKGVSCPDGLCGTYAIAETLHSDVTVQVFAPQGDYRKRDHRVSANAELIANAPADIAWLIDELRMHGVVLCGACGTTYNKFVTGADESHGFGKCASSTLTSERPHGDANG